MFLIGGCNVSQQRDVNIMQQELSLTPFYSEGTMSYNNKDYSIKLRRENNIKTTTIFSEKLGSPITYIINEGGIAIDNNGENAIQFDIQSIPERCIAKQIWDNVETLSSGDSQRFSDGITITKQDKAVLTADKDKKFKTLQITEQSITITLNHFEYLPK